MSARFLSRRVCVAMLVPLLVVTALAAPEPPPAAAQVPDADIDSQTLVAEQSLRTWQVRDLQPAEESSLPDWDVLVWDFAEMNGVMYVGGRFQSVRKSSGSTVHDQAFLAAFDVGTGQWLSTFRPRLDDGVYSLSPSPDGTRLLVGGEFTSVNGAPGTGGIAALDPFTGDPDPNWFATIIRESGDPVVMEIEVAGDDLYIGGRFSRIGGANGQSIRRYGLARLDPVTGAVDPSFDVPALGGRVMALDTSPDGSELYLGGFFTSVGLLPDTTWMAMIRPATGEVVPMADPIDPNLNHYVFDIAVAGDRVWAGTERHELFGWNRADLTRTHWYHTSSRGGDYQALLHHDGVLWAAGHYHGYERPHPGRDWYRQVNWITAYNAVTGVPVDDWIARMGARDGVFALTVDSEGKLWAGGDPTSSGTVPVSGFAVYPPRSDDTEVNLARGATATQSSDGPSGVSWRSRTSESRCNLGGFTLVGPASAATDGKTSGGPWECSFSSTGLEAAPWWQVDLGAEGEVDAVRIWNLYTVDERQDLADVWIAVSNDAAAIDSTDPAALAADPAVTLVQVPGELGWFHEEPIGINGQYVRVFMNPGTPSRLRLPEVEVLDLPGVNPPPPPAQGPGPEGESKELVTLGADWRYWDQAAPPAADWASPAYDAGAWPSGPAILGFGDPDIATTIGAGRITTYVRHEFDVADPAAITGLSLDLLADDGAVVYLNGTEIHRLRMPAGPITGSTPASDTVWGAAERAKTTVAVSAASLVAGTNVLAVEVHNNWTGGGDLAVDAALTSTGQVVAPPAVDQLLVPFDGDWRYLDDGSDPGVDWAGAGFDDAAWSTGPAQLGYGDGDEGTVINEGPVPDRHLTHYFRSTFDVADPASVGQLQLSLIRDDGAVVHVNGTEVWRNNMPTGPIGASTLASDYAWGAGESEPQVMMVPADALVAGTNVVAVEVHSADRGSRDLSFALEVVGIAP